MMKMEKVIIEWARLFEGPKDIFAEKLSNLKILYKQGPNIGGSIYQMVMDRQIASTEEKHRIEDERKRKELSRREQVRRLYFEKVFER